MITLSQKYRDLLRLLITHYESLHDGDLTQIGLQPKMDCDGVWTEGYGSLVIDDKGRKIIGIENKSKAYKFAKIHTVEEATNEMDKKIDEVIRQLNKYGVNAVDQQAVGLIDIAYNIGVGNYLKSKLYHYHDKTASLEWIQKGFNGWTKSGGFVKNGLIARRKSEFTMYEKGILKYYN